jgi:hypothetical protein
MKKTFVFATVFVGLCSASFGQTLQKISSTEAYDNVNHDRQRQDQLIPQPNAKYALIDDRYIPHAAPSQIITRNSSLDQLNNTKIITAPLYDYTGRNILKGK